MNTKQIQQIVGAYPDGIMGPETKAKIKAWQQANGLTADGIFGPKSIAKYNQLQNTNQNLGTTTVYLNSTGQAQTVNNSDLNAFLNSGNWSTTPPNTNTNLVQNVIQSLDSQGLQINPNMTLGPNEIAQILDAAKANIHPYYQEQIDAIKQDVIRQGPQLEQNYINKITDANTAFQNTLGSAREGWADTGTAFSGGRAKGELGLQSSQNRTLQDLATAYGNDIYNLGRTAEQKIGASNMQGLNLPSNIGTYGASLTGLGGINKTGTTTSGYNPGGYGTGSLTYDENAAIMARRNQNIEEASRRKANGLSYQDLLA